MIRPAASSLTWSSSAILGKTADGPDDAKVALMTSMMEMLLMNQRRLWDQLCGFSMSSLENARWPI